MNLNSIELVKSLNTNLKTNINNIKTSKEKFKSIMNNIKESESKEGIENLIIEDDFILNSDNLDEDFEDIKKDSEDINFNVSDIFIRKLNLSYKNQIKDEFEEAKIGKIEYIDLNEDIKLSTLTSLENISGKINENYESLFDDNIKLDFFLKENISKDSITEHKEEKIDSQDDEINPIVLEFKEKISNKKAENILNSFNNKLVDKDLISSEDENNIQSERIVSMYEQEIDKSEKEEDLLDYNFKNLDSISIIKNDGFSYEEKIDKLSMLNIKNIENQIIDEVKVINTEELKEINVQLYPKQLGNIKIELKLEDGNLKAKILVDNQVTKDLLTNSIGDLNKNLLKQNIELKEVFVDVNSDFNENNQNQENNENKRRRNLKRDLINEDININNLNLNSYNRISNLDNINFLV
ncbi:MAG TPA: flagellar hook-length control protein FliK [Tissierellaceae bacterium]